MNRGDRVQRAAGPQYRLLAHNLMEKIDSGVYPPGSLLPTELALCEQFNVSRITVRGALKELETKGLVSRRAGVGTRVEQRREQPAFTHLGGSIDEVLSFTKGLPLHVLAQSELIVSGELARQLELPEGQRFVRIETTRQKQGQAPVVYGVHYVPALLAPTAAEVQGLQFSLGQFMADRAGDEVHTVRQRFAAVSLRKAEAAHLEARAGAPALRSTRWYFGRKDRLLLVSVSLFPGNQYSFDSTLRRHSGT